jgi:protein-tyrosine phosphatase
MGSNFHFGPAPSGERTVYGARAPDSSRKGILESIRFMRRRGLTRVCCLLDQGQLAAFPVNLEAEYRKHFRRDRILMCPVEDHHLCFRQALAEHILPFLHTADLAGERVVVHCWGGNGRAGHVLAAWLVTARGLSPLEALEAVEIETQSTVEIQTEEIESSRNLRKTTVVKHASVGRTHVLDLHDPTHIFI